MAFGQVCMKKNQISFVLFAVSMMLAVPCLADSSNSSSSNSNNNNNYYQKKKQNNYSNPYGTYGPYGRRSKLPYKVKSPSTTHSLTDKNPRYDHWTNKRARRTLTGTLRYRKAVRTGQMQRKRLKKRGFLSRFIRALKQRFMAVKLSFMRDARARMENRDVAASRASPFHNAGGFGTNVHRSGRLVRDRWSFKKGKLPRSLRMRRKAPRRGIRVRRF